MDCLTPSEIMHLGKHLWKHRLTPGVYQSYKDAVRASAYKRPTTVQEVATFLVEVYQDLSKNFSEVQWLQAVNAAELMIEEQEK